MSTGSALMERSIDMAKLIGNAVLNVKATFELDEEELRAMEALSGYGNDAFIKVFYQHLGEAYMKKHEDGLRRVLDMFCKTTPSVLHMVDKARRALQPQSPNDNQRTLVDSMGPPQKLPFDHH